MSEFGDMLANDPELRKRYEEAKAFFDEACKEEIQACIDSEKITAADLAITINARAPGQ